MSWRPACFNPRPPLPGGAAATVLSIRRLDGMFQSSPPVAGGRSNAAVGVGVPFTYVSILAPRCRGAQRDSSPEVGDTVSVSILAPRCRGAQRHASGRQEHLRRVSILAPRCRGAQRDALVQEPMVARFQSSPPVAGGRSLARRLPRSVLKRFNPRPPLPGGAASSHCFQAR